MRDQIRREVGAERELEPEQPVQEQESRERYVAGQAPPVAPMGQQGGETASQLAYEEDDHERELKQKVGALVTNKFGGDYKKAFGHYDTDGDGAIGKSELVAMLADAGVGSGMTRGIWAGKIIDKLDSSSDKKIDWSEFESVFTARA